MSIYDFTVKNKKGEDVALNDYKGKVLLIINSATQCGFTPQYKPLQDLYVELHDKGFEILDFPCDQFGHQAPGSDEEIHSFCTGRFGITFPLFSKIEVNGDNALPLFKFLKEKKPFVGYESGKPKETMDMLEKYSNTAGHPDAIRWNFTKFLVDKDGNVVQRFEPIAEFDDIKKSILALL